MTTEQKFEQLPKQVQRARWDYFLACDGYDDEKIFAQKNIKKIKLMIAALEKMKALGDWGPNPEIWLNKLKGVVK